MTHTGAAATVVTSSELAIPHVTDVLDPPLHTVLSAVLMLHGTTLVSAPVHQTGLRTIALSSSVSVAAYVSALRDVMVLRHVIVSSAYQTLTSTSRDSANATTSGQERAVPSTSESVTQHVMAVMDHQIFTATNV